MEGSPTPKTPEQTPVNDGDEGVVEGSSPVKPVLVPVAGHNAEEERQRTMPTTLQGVTIDQMYNLLGTTMEDMSKAFPNCPTMETTLKQSKGSLNEKSVAKYLNDLSDIVHKSLGNPPAVIRFFDNHLKAPKDHPTGTGNRPDLLAVKLPVCMKQHKTATSAIKCAKTHIGQASQPPSQFYWSALEATGELLSGSDKEASRTKSAAYTSYLLQARPDMVIVQGIYVDPSCFSLVVSNACGAFHTEDLEWGPRTFRLLLCAWVWRLYNPFVDSSITVNIEANETPTFNIKLPDVEYPNCRIHSTGTAFGRRTIIFACPDPKVIIKEQYIEKSRRFEEGSILAKIHENGTFPGVVRPDWCGLVQSGEEELTVGSEEGEEVKKVRRKTRAVLLDKAPSIMDAKTPREVLVAMYDLLEITRFLKKNRKILHRDISCNNVLLRPVVPPAQSSAGSGRSITEELHDMCFASYLLRTKSNSSSDPTKLDTGVVLIDYDMALDEEEAKHKKVLHAQTGTPIFVARAVVSGRQKNGEYVLMPMPQFDQANETDEAYKAYKDAVPGRLEAFPANKKEYYEVPADIPHNPFKHKLHYDAESVFWLLVWWAIQAYPNEESPGGTKIDSRHWNALTEKQDANEDPRERFVKEPFDNVLHPSYKPLETLLAKMAQQLRGDHEKGEVLLKEQNPDREEDLSRKQPDYLHETFQRLIIKFLYANYNEEFMTKQKGPDFRTPNVVQPRVPGLSSFQIDKARASRSKTEASGGSSSLPFEPSYNLRSDSSGNRKRKAPDEDASSSDSNDGDWAATRKPKRHKPHRPA